MEKIIKLDENFDKKVFNGVSTHPLQSWEWGEARKRMGITVVRFGEFHNNSLTKVYQVTFHKIPFTPFTIGYLPRSVMPSRELMSKLRLEGRRQKAIFIKLEPNIENTELSHSQLSMLDLKKSHHPLFPQWTQILDLQKNEESLFKNLKQKTRYNIRLAEKNGVIVKEISNEKGYSYFEELYFKTTQRQKYFGHSKKYHQIIFDALKENISHILIAFYKEKPLAAYHLFLFNGVLYYPYGGSSDENKNLMGSNLIMWDAIRLGKKYNAHTFDMWGSLPAHYNKESQWAGFTRFKEGYGTKFFEFIGSYDLVINHMLYTSYNIMDILRKIFMKIKLRSFLN